MARYRKRPVVIEAVQLTWENWNEICTFADVGPGERQPHGCYVDSNGFTHDKPPTDDALLGLRIPTLEGVMLGVEGDFIIRGVSGELYPCKPDIFWATYEKAEDE